MYFTVTVAVVAVMFLRIQILKVILAMSRAIVERVHAINDRVSLQVRDKIGAINSQAVVFFTRGDNAANLNKAALYVRANEQTRRMIVVHVYGEEQEIPPNRTEDLKQIDRLFPELRIDFVGVKGRFGPELIERLAARLTVPKNDMFIGCPGDRFPHNIADLGRVRLILRKRAAEAAVRAARVGLPATGDSIEEAPPVWALTARHEGSTVSVG